MNTSDDQKQDRLCAVGRAIVSPAKLAEMRRVSQALKPSRRWQPMVRQPADSHPEAEVWLNHLYTATLRRFAQGWPLGGGPWAMIGLYCEDGEARHDWRDFQRVKNDLVGPEWEALELYPAESRLLDPSNYYMLWCAPRIPVGKYEPRLVMRPESAFAHQRGWAPGDAPQDAL